MGGDAGDASYIWWAGESFKGLGEGRNKCETNGLVRAGSGERLSFSLPPRTAVKNTAQRTLRKLRTDREHYYQLASEQKALFYH